MRMSKYRHEGCMDAHTSRYNSPCLGDSRQSDYLISHICGSPIGQSLPATRTFGHIFEKVLNRVTHVHNRQLPMRVRRSAYASQLENCSVQMLLWSTASLTFSSIFERGPPPPSPFPKTSSAVSEDSKFCGEPLPLLSPIRDEEMFCILCDW